jgi:hypothetical protein
MHAIKKTGRIILSILNLKLSLLPRIEAVSLVGDNVRHKLFLSRKKKDVVSTNLQVIEGQIQLRPATVIFFFFLRPAGSIACS